MTILQMDSNDKIPDSRRQGIRGKQDDVTELYI